MKLLEVPVLNMAYAKQTKKLAAHQKKSNNLNLNMVHEACRKNLHDVSNQVLRIIAERQQNLPWDNQRLPGPVETDKQCNARPLPGFGRFGRDYCPHGIH
jgi:hypothetical protein